MWKTLAFTVWLSALIFILIASGAPFVITILILGLIALAISI